VKTILYVRTDVKGRRHGYRIGLETLIVHAENDECHKIAKNRGVSSAQTEEHLFYFINESVSIPPQEYCGNT
jgi:hypothetical protein